MEKIILIVHSFPKPSETFIVSKFLGLLGRDWDVHVVCRGSNKSDWNYFPELTSQKNIRKRIHVSWPHKPGCLAVFLFPFAFIKGVIRNPYGVWRYCKQGWRLKGFRVFKHFYFDLEIISLKPDIIHFEFGALAAGKMYLKDALGAKIVTSFRGYDINITGLDKPKFYQEVWLKTDAFHFLSEDLLEKACQRGFFKGKQYHIIPPAIDIDFFRPREKDCEKVLGDSENNPLKILSVGRLEWRKGYEYALEAISLLAKENLNLEYRIAGDGDFFEAIAFARYQFGVEGRVKLLGAITAKRIREEMDWADIFLHSAVSEGFCNAVLEAQAMELPVVCSDAGGLTENVKNQETGFVVERRNPKLLARKIKILAQDPLLRKQMGQAGRERVSKKFALEQQIELFSQLYKDIR